MNVSNNVSSPNFGMALKIDKLAKEPLKKCDPAVIENLRTAGERIKDTKFYHVVVDKNLDAKLTAEPDAFFGVFDPKIAGVRSIKHGREDNIVMINDAYGVARYPVYNNSKKVRFNAWSYAPLTKVEDVQDLATIAKVLDKAAVAKYEEEAAKQAIKEASAKKAENIVDDLILDYGV